MTALRSKAFALTWYRALNWYCSPARPFAAPDVPLLVTGQQGSPTPACRQLFRARNACAGSSSAESTKLKHGTKLGRTLCYFAPRPTTRSAYPQSLQAYTRVRVNPRRRCPVVPLSLRLKRESELQAFSCVVTEHRVDRAAYFAHRPTACSAYRRIY